MDLCPCFRRRSLTLEWMRPPRFWHVHIPLNPVLQFAELSSYIKNASPLIFDETKGRPFYFCVMHRCKETNPNLKTLLVCRSRSFCLLPLPMSPDAPILYLITNLQLPMSPGAPILCLITNLNSSPHGRPWWNVQNWYWKSRFRGLSVVAGRTPGQWSWMSY